MLFRRRMVWWPTVWGTLLLGGLAALSIAALAWFATDLLAVTEPARGPHRQGADTLVVEGWMTERELLEAVGVFRRGRYRRVWVTGGPIGAAEDFGGWKNYAVRATAYLTAHGLPSTLITAVPARDVRRDRTYENGVAVRDWSLASGTALPAIDLFTSSLHTRRSRLLYRLALGQAVEVGVIAALPNDVDTRHWWRSSDATKATLVEALGLAWAECCFWPPHPAPLPAAPSPAPTSLLDVPAPPAALQSVPTSPARASAP